MNTADLVPCGIALLVIQLARRRARQPPLRAVYDGSHHLQIAQQFGGCAEARFRFLPLRLEKKLRRIEDTFADC